MRLLTSLALWLALLAAQTAAQRSPPLDRCGRPGGCVAAAASPALEAFALPIFLMFANKPVLLPRPSSAICRRSLRLPLPTERRQLQHGLLVRRCRREPGRLVRLPGCAQPLRSAGRQVLPCGAPD